MIITSPYKRKNMRVNNNLKVLVTVGGKPVALYADYSSFIEAYCLTDLPLGTRVFECNEIFPARDLAEGREILAQRAALINAGATEEQLQKLAGR